MTECDGPAPDDAIDRVIADQDKLLEQRQRALAGELLYYKVGYSEVDPAKRFPKRFGTAFVFSETPLDEESLRRHVPQGATHYDMQLMVPSAIAREIEIEGLYESCFDETGTVATLTIPLEAE